MMNGSAPRPTLYVTHPSRSLTMAFVFACIAATVLTLPMVPHLDRVVLALVMVGSMVLYLTLRRQAESMDYLEVFLPYGLFEIMSFAFSALYLTYSKLPVVPLRASLEPYLTSALALGAVGFLSFTAGYGLCVRGVTPSRTHGLMPRKILAFLLPGALGFVGYMADIRQNTQMLSGQGISPVFSALQQFIPLFLFAWSMVWQTFWAGHEPRLRNWPLLAVFISMTLVLIYLTVGGKELTITLLAFPALAYCSVRRAFPWKTVFVLLLVSIFLIFPIYNTFRFQNRHLDTSERLDMTLQQAQRWDAETYFDRSAEAFLRRMGVITSVSAIIRDTGRFVDFQYGRTLILAPIGFFIPRILWPEKPSIVIGREFGVTFQLVGPSDDETSVAVSAIGELYWNFHIPGVLIGMFILGAGYRWYYLKYGMGTAFDPVRKSIYLALLSCALHAEGNVAAVVSGFIKSLFIFSALLFVLRRIGAVSYARKEEEGAAEPAT